MFSRERLLGWAGLSWALCASDTRVEIYKRRPNAHRWPSGADKPCLSHSFYPLDRYMLINHCCCCCLAVEPLKVWCLYTSVSSAGTRLIVIIRFWTCRDPSSSGPVNHFRRPAWTVWSSPSDSVIYWKFNNSLYTIRGNMTGLNKEDPWKEFIY